MSTIDLHTRNRLYNIGHLLSGNVASGLIGLGATALTARALGPVDYGVLALTLGFSRAVERLVTFQSWQPLIKFGAALAPDDHEARRSLFKFGLTLDIIGALAAWLVAVSITLLASQWLGWSFETRESVLIYTCVLPFNLNGMATAVLRLYGRYRVAAYGPVVGGMIRLGLCLVALEIGAGLVEFTAIWMLTQIVGSLLVLTLAIRVLRENGVHNILRAPLTGIARRFEGVWGFAWTSNLSLTIQSSAQQLDVLIVGAFAGPAEAGLYHIAKRIGRTAEEVATQVQAVIYPDIARQWAAGKIVEMRRIVRQVKVLMLLTGALGVGFFALAGAPLLKLLAGPGFTGAAPLLIVQMIAVTLAMTGSASRSALLSMGRQRTVLVAVLVGTAAFHITALLLIPVMGAMGANVAHIVLAAIVTGTMVVSFRRGTTALAARAP